MRVVLGVLGDQLEAGAQAVVDVGAAAGDDGVDGVDELGGVAGDGLDAHLGGAGEGDEGDVVAGLEAVEHAHEAVAHVGDRLALHGARGVDDEAEVERRTLEGLDVDRGVEADQDGDAVGAGDHVAHLTEQAVQAHVVVTGGLGQDQLVLVEEADVVDGVGARDVAAIEDLLELTEVLGAALTDAEAALVATLVAGAAGSTGGAVVGESGLTAGGEQEEGGTQRGEAGRGA